MAKFPTLTIPALTHVIILGSNHLLYLYIMLNGVCSYLVKHDSLLCFTLSALTGTWLSSASLDRRSQFLLTKSMMTMKPTPRYTLPLITSRFYGHLIVVRIKAQSVIFFYFKKPLNAARFLWPVPYFIASFYSSAYLF